MNLIDRDAAIRTIEWWFGILDQNPDILIDSIISLPSIQPERKKGEWIDLKCNQCGQVDMSKPNFCPSCGADMRGEQDE